MWNVFPPDCQDYRNVYQTEDTIRQITLKPRRRKHPKKTIDTGTVEEDINHKNNMYTVVYPPQKA